MEEDKINCHIGERIRALRRMNGMSQTDLGKKLGVTFQQIQKYEKGYNKMVASKLFDLSQKMNVDIGFFFEGIENSIFKNKDSLKQVQEEFVHFDDEAETSSRETILLVKLYNNIKNNNARKRLLLFLKSLIDEQD